MSLSIIAMIDMGFGIGDDKGRLLYNIPKDMKRFKKITTNHKIIMGRKTWDSLPNKPLENRFNYVLTRDEDFIADGAMKITSLDEIKYISEDEEVFIIGGAEIYHQTINIVDKMYITHVHTVNQNATSFFPDFNHKQWKIESSEFHNHTQKNSSFSFTTYTRKK